MADGYLSDIIPSDDWPVRQVKTQRWMKLVAQRFAAEFNVGPPLTGGYLIDLQPMDTKQTINCTLVAWAKAISDQTP